MTCDGQLDASVAAHIQYSKFLQTGSRLFLQLGVAEYPSLEEALVDSKRKIEYYDTRDPLLHNLYSRKYVSSMLLTTIIQRDAKRIPKEVYR